MNKTKSHESVEKPSHATYLKRRLGAAALAGLMFAGGIFGVNKLKSGGDEPAPTEPYVVQEGDTLWDIAEAGTDGDPRGLVAELRDQPDAQDGLHPGDILQVPATEAPTDVTLSEGGPHVELLESGTVEHSQNPGEVTERPTNG